MLKTLSMTDERTRRRPQALLGILLLWNPGFSSIRHLGIWGKFHQLITPEQALSLAVHSDGRSWWRPRLALDLHHGRDRKSKRSMNFVPHADMRSAYMPHCCHRFPLSSRLSRESSSNVEVSG